MMGLTNKIFIMIGYNFLRVINKLQFTLRITYYNIYSQQQSMCTKIQSYNLSATPHIYEMSFTSLAHTRFFENILFVNIIYVIPPILICVT